LTVAALTGRLRSLRRTDTLVAGWLAFGALSLVAYFALPSHDLQDFAYQVPGMLSVLAVLAGVWRHRPARPAPWIVLAAGLALSTAGAWTWVILERVFAIEPFPSVADAFYLIGMGLVAVAVIGLLRGRIPGGDRAGLLDALIVAAGVGLASWIFVMAPIALDPEIGLFETAVALAYPLLDIVLLAVLVRLFLAPGRQVPALVFLLLALLTLLLADFPYAVLALEETYNTGDLVEIGWLAAAFFWGAAALHPSMREIARPAPLSSPTLPVWRVALLAVASLMAPAMLLVQWTTDQPIHVPIIALGCVVLFGLVIARLAGLVSDLNATLRQRQLLERELERRALHDPLTGLANRVLFRDRLDAALAQRGTSAAVLFLDLDDFKGVNDTYGHQAGDLLLGSVADSLRSVVRASDTVARLGGDEFAVLVVQGASAVAASELADRLLASIRGSGVVAGWDRPVGASIGISVGTGGSDNAEELMREADVAMYVAKSHGKDGSVVFDAAVHDTLARGLSTRPLLERAIRENQLELHYQPIIELEHGDLAGVEALVRWRHPTRGLLPPAEFIPAAEASGVIVELGQWVIREAIRQAGAWQRNARTGDLLANGRFVSINVSPLQLSQPGLASLLTDAAADAGIDPRQIVLELTESAHVAVEETAEALAALRGTGVRLAIDDFGSGFASSARLLLTAFDIVKIDAALIAALERDARAERVVAGLLELARRVDATVVAEGIEQPGQLSRLRQIGCAMGQGFHFSPAVPPAELEALFAAVGPARVGRPNSAQARVAPIQRA
jgi:diguanylate cyclase (GGDEF)-like protein